MKKFKIKFFGSKDRKEQIKQVKMEIAAEYEMYPEDVFDLIELGYNKENSKLRVKRSKERTSFSKTGHLE